MSGARRSAAAPGETDAAERADSAIVLDIMRASFHDGPGVRTTVFLKGCPLRCVWCHNPESQAFAPQLSFDAARCTACGGCVKECPCAAATASPALGPNRALCRVCGACAAACPAQALSVKGAAATPEAVLCEIMKDKHFYDSSGGGATVSGGEPMSRFAFTKALLAGCRRLGVSTALETCGFAPAVRYDEIAPLTDLFLFDCKGVDSARHAANTGVPNALILANLRRLHDGGAALILRCPLVPGLNDSDDDLRALAALERSLPRLAGLEIMPYHRMGVEKGRRAGMDAPFDAPSVPPETQAAWLAALRAHGSVKAALGV